MSAPTVDLPRELFETCEHLTPIAEDCNECEPILVLGEILE